MDYKSTLNLPQTDFPMKADLVTREPARLTGFALRGSLHPDITSAAVTRRPPLRVIARSTRDRVKDIATPDYLGLTILV